MHIVLGATGQVGSLLVAELLKRGEIVRAIVRDVHKAPLLQKKGADVSIADYSDPQGLKTAFQGCKTAFLITPENPFSEHYPEEVCAMLSNYREAVVSSGVDFVIVLSSMGAQHESGTGNLMFSYKLENLFTDVKIKKTFIRPAYYFSNWAGYVDMAKESGFLPSFFPTQLKIPMIAPCDVAAFVADVMTGAIEFKPLYEIYHDDYSAEDISDTMSKAINRDVTVAAIPQSDWINSLKQVGFSDSGASNVALMTEAVVNGKTKPETELVKLPTDFESYLTDVVKQ